MEQAQSISLPAFKSERHHKERIFEIDFLRGFAIFLMIMLHGCCAFFDIGPGKMIALPDRQPNPAEMERVVHFFSTVFATIDFGNLWILEFFFSGMFMFLCGISCSFAKSNYERGLQLAFVSVGLTLTLEIADYFLRLNPGFHIVMGILHSMTLGILFYALIDHFFPSFWVDYAIGIILAIADMVIVYFVYSGSDSVGMVSTTDPVNDWWKLLLGLARYGDDYFSPINTGAFIFLGATVGKTLYHSKKSILPSNFPTRWAKPILWCGSNSLIIYVFHMPFFYLLLLLILLPFGYRLYF
jgi:uncharacterized membrane protein